MEKFLADYIDRMTSFFSEIPETAAHELASAFLSFRYGLYANTVRECRQADKQIPEHDANRALRKAVSILQAQAESLQSSQITGANGIAFTDDERRYLAINIPAGIVEDPETLDLDNALVMVYTAALVRSPDDEQPLGEHRTFIVRMLAGYKKVLGLE